MVLLDFSRFEFDSSSCGVRIWFSHKICFACCLQDNDNDEWVRRGGNKDGGIIRVTVAPAASMATAIW